MYVYKAEVKPQDGEVAKTRRGRRGGGGGGGRMMIRTKKLTDEYADDKEGAL